MTDPRNALLHKAIQKAYAAFNARNIDAVLSTLHPKVRWANGWEGGFLDGHIAVREYWKRQWAEIDPHVEPIAFKERENGRLEVEVHQIVKDLKGVLVFDGKLKHVFAFEKGLIRSMEIEK